MQTVANNVEMLNITPEMAAFILKSNTNNRPVRRNNLDSLTRDMIEGRYQFNGDSVRIDKNGVLLDGQHRLMAIVESGKSQKMILVTGLEPETMKTIDSGVKRTTGDRLSLSGYRYGNSIAAVLNIIHGIAHGAEKRNLTSTEAFEVLDRHYDIESSLTATAGCPIVARSCIAAIHYIATYTGHGAFADEFIEVFKSGHHTNPNHPARVARERIIRMKDGGRRSVVRQEQLEILTAAWENMRIGKDVKNIRGRTGENRIRMHGWDAEKFWGYAKK